MDSNIKITDLQKDILFPMVKYHTEAIQSVAFSKTKPLIFTGSDKSFKIWNAKTGELLLSEDDTKPNSNITPIDDYNLVAFDSENKIFIYKTTPPYARVRYINENSSI